MLATRAHPLMPATNPVAALACILALAMGILLLIVPWSNDPEAGTRTFWDRIEGPREDGQRISRDVWHEPEKAPVAAALALVTAIGLLLPCALAAVSGGPASREGVWRRWTLVAGALLVLSAVAWTQGPWRTFGAGPTIAVGAGILALWAGATRATSAPSPQVGS